MKLFIKIVATFMVCVLPLSAAAQMITEQNAAPVKKQVELTADVVVCGGGLAGVCAAVSAARHGAKVILVQDRPVLGGNASSEMRMGIVGAKTDELQETGILEEMQLRNFYYNPLQRYTMWDDAIYSTVVSEPNIKLLLNTSVNDVVMNGERIAAVKAWNINAYTEYLINGTIFADCTGDGILRLSGAKFRRGRELPTEFNETYLQEGGDSKTMGNSILLQLRKTDVDVPFKAPEWAYHFTDDDFNYDTPKSTIPGVKFNYKRIYHPHDNNFWWCEFGGNFDTIANANDIQYELKRIVYGIWEYMKNHPDGRGKGYELDWIGSLPGKRESTRFVGPHILTQHDVLSGGHFPDVVAYGGWTLDDHHPDAFHKKGRISVEYDVPQGFGIPFGVLYSVNVPNLMFAGRDISATHMGLSATRVMATCALLGQAAGTGVAVAIEKGVMPAEVHAKHIAQVQTMLEDDDCLLPYRWRKVSDLTASATMSKDIEILRNGIDRTWEKKDNGVWVAPGEESIVYKWEKPVTISGARLIFDSQLKVRSKRMRKLEATTERVKMPDVMAKKFRIEAFDGKEWKCVFEEKDKDNYLRLRKVSFAPVKATQLRVVVTETWGAEKAHIFAFDAL
ncbi:MAG: FAD-dependent oxidoreductase [Alistipes sp.]|nr:FAD-dependent oxidoreductase [Alistipes sp.]